LGHAYGRTNHEDLVVGPAVIMVELIRCTALLFLYLTW
jgi:hypothetical protein